MNPESLVGQQTSFSKTISESDVYLFAGITGDLAGYHVNAEAMRSSEYGQRIVHGVLTLSFLSTASTLFWETRGESGLGVSLGYDHVRFVHPVFIGDTITARYTMASWDPGRQRMVAEGEITNQHDQVCLVAQHLTKLLEVTADALGVTRAKGRAAVSRSQDDDR